MTKIEVNAVDDAEGNVIEFCASTNAAHIPETRPILAVRCDYIASLTCMIERTCVQ